jgi:MYXO-CTERM domain-containing protein
VSVVTGEALASPAAPFTAAAFEAAPQRAVVSPPADPRRQHTPQGDIMRRTITTAAIAAALSAIPVSTAFATTPPNDPNDVTQVDNPTDENDSGGFDDWGLLGLLGLAGLAGLKRRNDRVTTVRDDNLTRH